MHLIIIIAFAALLWFNSTTSMNLLKMSADVSVFVVLAQVLLILVVALITTRKTIRVLEKHPDDPNEAQHVHHVCSIGLQILLLLSFLVDVTLTGWPDVIESKVGSMAAAASLPTDFGIAELIILSPFLVGMLSMWVVQYPADRAIRQLALNPRLAGAHPVHAVWTIGQYLIFNIRHQLLTIALPMAIIIFGDDLRDAYKDGLRKSTGLFWAPDALLGLLVCAVFLFAPVMLRYTWTTSPLPDGELRGGLEHLASKLKLRYRQILVWHSRGMVVNAAVMGLFGPVRYVLITDGLLESMTDRQIEAVFGHEAGHIRHWHIPYFILFATLSMLIAGGLMLLLLRYGPAWLTPQYTQLIVGAVVVVLWGVAFGWLSHQFEYQADVAGATSISQLENDLHNPAGAGLTVDGALEFGQALQRVAALNGIPREDRGWRHPSINDRVGFLQRVSQDPSHEAKFMKRLKLAKVVLIGGTLVGLAVAAYIYRNQLLPRGWLS